MIVIDLVLPQIPYELDVQRMIDQVRAVIMERYGILPEVVITDQDIVNILQLSGLRRG